jgi:hypothetical protein
MIVLLHFISFILILMIILILILIIFFSFLFVNYNFFSFFIHFFHFFLNRVIKAKAAENLEIYLLKFLLSLTLILSETDMIFIQLPI